ncbi:uncharacterized protein STEHIDRAFT_163836 [Stereum hirsutum FP-91666 SS1]|uniref:Uncharacterized protein n=1 Tax=Stereum hirsutum (strain FP-91666) TaxID=721885 RepID=R7RVT6_STEHR|nr:uncharacterized protein STEHIDRAFT_163836 [Stereum hirsutum FP-91666 SS1]EIM79316.1 hypothetical protein STEHIDRAFT_163836 [Stereum hirsutum FP-91666 SS1]
MARGSTHRPQCAYARASSAPYSTTGNGSTLQPKAKAAPRKKATSEEIAKRKAMAEKKKVWIASLIEWKDPFNGGRPYQQVKGTMCMFKSDGKHAYGLTEQEILTLPHETIQNSRKSYYACADLGALSLRKLHFIDPSFVIPPEDLERPKPISRGLVNAPRKLMEKTKDGPRRIKSNYKETSVYMAVRRETEDTKVAILFGARSLGFNLFT